MNLLIARGMLLLGAIVLLLNLNVESVHAQRGGGGSSQQDSFGVNNSAFGASGPSQGLRQQGGSQVGGSQAGQNGRGQSQNQTSRFNQGNNGQAQRGGQDGFIGNDARQMRNERNRRNANQQRRRNVNAVENLNDRRQDQRGQGNRGGQGPKVWVRIRPLFLVQPHSSPALNTKISSQMRRALPTHAATTSVSIKGSTATLVGSVASDYEKRLAAKMLSLQPGILKVENNLTIVPNSATR